MGQPRQIVAYLILIYSNNCNVAGCDDIKISASSTIGVGVGIFKSLKYSHVLILAFLKVFVRIVIFLFEPQEISVLIKSCIYEIGGSNDWQLS